MKKIETYDDLIDWSNRANLNMASDKKGMQERIDLQDEMGHSEAKVIEKLWQESIDRNDQRLVAFALHKIMGDDYLGRYINIWVHYKWDQEVEKWNTNHDLRWKEIHEAEVALKEARKTVERRIRLMRNILQKRIHQDASRRLQIHTLNTQIASLRNSLHGAEEHAMAMEEDAMKYRELTGKIGQFIKDMEKSGGA